MYVKVNHLRTGLEDPACKIAETLQIHRHRMVPEVTRLYKWSVTDTEWCNNLMKLPIADSTVGNI